MFLFSFSTDDNLTSGVLNNSYNLLTAHSSHNQQPSMQMHLQTTAISSSSSIPNSMSNNIYQSSMVPTSNLVQSQSHTQPLEQLAYSEEEFFPPTAGIDEQYIYVTYPSEVKKRMSDRYELLLSNDGYGAF